MTALTLFDLDAPRAVPVPGRTSVRAVGLFLPGGPTGWQARNHPHAPVRPTYAAALADARAHHATVWGTA